MKIIKYENNDKTGLETICPYLEQKKLKYDNIEGCIYVGSFSCECLCGNCLYTGKSFVLCLKLPYKKLFKSKDIFYWHY